MLRMDLLEQLGVSGKGILPVIHIFDEALTNENIEG